MKTSAELVKEVEAELNAVRAADMGLEAIEAFAQEALQRFEAGDVLKTKEALTNLVGLVGALRKAVPANVIPASAGPVGSSPHEQFLEQAHEAAKGSLERMQAILGPLREVLVGISEAIDQANQITALKIVSKS